MGKQESIFPVSGSVQGFTFYKSGDGYMVRAKSSLNKQRVMEDASFERSRQASAEFGRAGTAARLLRDAFRTTGQKLGDSRILARLTGKLVGLMATDTAHAKGERLVEACDLDGLKGFEWNKATRFDSLINVSVGIAVDDSTGLVGVNIAGLVPNEDIKSPAGATHYEIVMGAAAIDFANGTYSRAEDTTGWMPINGVSTAVALSASLSDFADRWLFAGVGIHFGIQTGGKVDAMADKKALAFVMG